jgi:hypothetical protein
MPIVPFDSLPADARVWVFAADARLTPAAETALLDEVDAFLTQWNAHGTPLSCARAWRDHRFLAIGVDQAAAGASGCSIDGMFRVLQRAQPNLGANLLPGPRVYWRDAGGAIVTGARREFTEHARTGDVSGATVVFDTAAATADDWRRNFERPAAASWHADLLTKP